MVHHFSRQRITKGLLIAAVVTAGGAQAATPVGDQFQVNTYTTGMQTSSQVAVHDSGDFVVVWSSPQLASGEQHGIEGQRFLADGSPLGGPFHVNDSTVWPPSSSSVATLPGGEFVVVWDSYGSGGNDGSYCSVLGRRFDSAGVPVGVEFQVNTEIEGYQVLPDVAAAPDGTFIVVWKSDVIGGDGSVGINGQRYSADGTVLGGEFQVNDVTTGYQLRSAVAVGTDGRFVVAWEDTRFGAERDIFGRRFASDGLPIGGDFQVNTYTTGEQVDPHIGMDDGGAFIIVWKSNGSDNGDVIGSSVQARRYDAEGLPQGAEFLVNEIDIGSQIFPDVAVEPGGGFSVVWVDVVGNEGEIEWRSFSSDGVPISGENTVNTYNGLENLPAAATNGRGELVVSWTSDVSPGDDSSSLSIQAQRFAVEDIFSDGFESGDLSAWSQ